MRLAMPDAACKSVDVPTAHGTVRYQPDRSGSVEVDNPAHARWLMRDAECFPASGATAARPGGYPCSCGFNSFFVVCSRCGRRNPKG